MGHLSARHWYLGNSVNELGMTWVLNVATLKLAFDQQVALEAKGILLKHWQ